MLPPELWHGWAALGHGSGLLLHQRPHRHPVHPGELGTALGEPLPHGIGCNPLETPELGGSMEGSVLRGDEVAWRALAGLEFGQGSLCYTAPKLEVL